MRSSVYRIAKPKLCILNAITWLPVVGNVGERAEPGAVVDRQTPRFAPVPENAGNVITISGRFNSVNGHVCYTKFRVQSHFSLVPLPLPLRRSDILFLMLPSFLFALTCAVLVAAADYYKILDGEQLA